MNQHQLELFAAVGQGERAVERALAALWRELKVMLRTTEGPANDYARALAILRRVGSVTTATLRQRLAGLYRQGFTAAARIVIAKAKRRIREDEAGPEPFDVWLDLFKPPSDQSVMYWLDRFIHPEQYNRIGTDTDKRLPEVLAQQMASDISQGKSQFEIAKGIRPFLDGSRMRARRAARTFGMYVAHQGQLGAWEQAPEIVVGYTIHWKQQRCPPGRAAHRARDGTTYWRNPKPGQKGLAEMPHPPLEADGSISWNCHCHLTPLI